MKASEQAPHARPVLSAAIPDHRRSLQPLSIALQALLLFGSAELAPLGAQALKIEVDHDALYRVEGLDIAEFFEVDAQSIERAIRLGGLELKRDGLDVAWTPSRDGQALLFYGQGRPSPWAESGVYRLQMGPGTRMSQSSGGNPPPGTIGNYRRTRHIEKQSIPVPHLVSHPEQDFWLWQRLQSDDPAQASRLHNLQVQGAVPSAQPATLRVRLRGGRHSPGTPDHAVRLTLNGQPLGDFEWDGTELLTIDLDLAPGNLIEGDNSLLLEALPTGGPNPSTFYVDSLQWSYERQLAIDVGPLQFTAHDGAVVTLANHGNQPLAVDRLRLLDLRRILQPRLMVDLTLTPPGGEQVGGQILSFQPRPGGGPFALVPDTAIEAPLRVRLDHPSDLASPQAGANYVVIAPAQLLTGAQALVDLRRGLGWRARLVDLEDIYDEFAGGHVDPGAIRRFLIKAHAVWDLPPSHLALVGAGSYDYMDRLGLGASLVPPLLVGSPEGLIASDSYLGDVQGEDLLPEVSIGRIPVTSNSQLEAYVLNLMAFENARPSLRRRLLLVADDADAVGNYPQDLQQAAGLLASTLELFYLDLSGGDTARTRHELLTLLDRGVGAMVFSGQGGSAQLAAENLLDDAVVSNLHLQGQTPFLAAGPAPINRFAVPGDQALGERMVLHQDGAWIAVLAPTGPVSYSAAKTVNESFLTSVSAGSATAGDALRQALARLVSTGATTQDLVSYTLLGDPAISLPGVD